MANADEQTLLLWDEWLAETAQQSGDPGEFTDWCLANRKLGPRPQDIRQMLRKQISQTLRSAKRFDEDGGFTYRAKQCVTLFDIGGIAIKHYFDTDTGGTEILRQKSTKQRREAIANSVYRATCDIERMNKNFPDEPQLKFVFDFADDVAELRAAELMGNDDNEDGNESGAA